MIIKIVFHGQLKRYNNNIVESEIELKEDDTVARILAKTGVPEKAIAFVAVNGSRVPMSYKVSEGDEVKLFQVVGGG